jgi:PaaX-like protein C-terminal domain
MPLSLSSAAVSSGPALSRRHAAGAPSARGLLLAVLGELVLPGDGTAWTSAVVAALARLGGGGEGSPPGAHAHRSGRLAGSGEGRSADPVAADRQLSPHPDREAEAIGVLHAAGVADDARVFVASRAGVGDVRVMVAQAWDLTAVEEHYERFIDEFGGRDPEDVLTRQVELVHAWRRFPSIDPVLPRELLPDAGWVWRLPGSSLTGTATGWRSRLPTSSSGRDSRPPRTSSSRSAGRACRRSSGHGG